MKKPFVCFVIALLFCSAFVFLAAPAQGAEVPASQSTVDWWSTFRHDASHSGYSTFNGPTTDNVLWNFSTGGNIESSISVDNGYAYVPTTGGTVYCLNASTGLQNWFFTAGAYVFTPTISNGYAYVSSYDHNLYCLNTQTGAEIWKFTVGGNAYPPTVANGNVYFGSADGNLYCLNAQTGAKVWSYSAGAGMTGSPAVSNGYVYIGSNNNNLYCLNAQTGAEVWSFAAGSYVYSSPTVANGYVYFGSQDHNLYCLNAQTGAEVWSYTTGYNVFSSPAVANGFVYIGSEDFRMYCLNAQSGSVVWSFKTGNYVLSSPAVSSNGEIYFGSSDSYIYCLDATTGSQVWTHLTGGYVYSSPALANGTLFVGSSDGYVYAFGSLSSSQPSTNSSGTAAVWTPTPTNGAAAVGVAAVAIGAVSFAVSTITNPIGSLNRKVGDKTEGAIPDNIKSWLEAFVSSKREAGIEAKTGSPFLPTGPEALAYVLAILVLALAFSYVQVTNFSQITNILPLILFTSVIVALVKKFFTIAYMRSRGVWSEHQIWPLGLVLFTVTTLAFKVPFSSPTRNLKISSEPKSKTVEKDSSSPSEPKENALEKHIKRIEGISSAYEVIIGILFAAMFFAVLQAGFTLVGGTGLAMCIIGCFFDTLPIAPMGGKNIFDYSKKVWIGLFVGTMALYIAWILLF